MYFFSLASIAQHYASSDSSMIFIHGLFILLLSRMSLDTFIIFLYPFTC